MPFHHRETPVIGSGYQPAAMELGGALKKWLVFVIVFFPMRGRCFEGTSYRRRYDSENDRAAGGRPPAVATPHGGPGSLDGSSRVGHNLVEARDVDGTEPVATHDQVFEHNIVIPAGVAI